MTVRSVQIARKHAMPAHKAGRESETMSENAQLTLTMPDRLVQVVGPNLAGAGPAGGAGTPPALELRHPRYVVAIPRRAYLVRDL